LVSFHWKFKNFSARIQRFIDRLTIFYYLVNFLQTELPTYAP